MLLPLLDDVVCLQLPCIVSGAMCPFPLYTLAGKFVPLGSARMHFAPLLPHMLPAAPLRQRQAKSQEPA